MEDVKRRKGAYDIETLLAVRSGRNEAEDGPCEDHSEGEKQTGRWELRSQFCGCWAQFAARWEKYLTQFESAMLNSFMCIPFSILLTLSIDDVFCTMLLNGDL